MVCLQKILIDLEILNNETLRFLFVFYSKMLFLCGVRMLAGIGGHVELGGGEAHKNNSD